MKNAGFGRTGLSICGDGTTFHGFLHIYDPVGPSFQGMPAQSFVHDWLEYCFCFFLTALLYDHR